jgi:predicted transcriptional regulator
MKRIFALLITMSCSHPTFGAPITVSENPTSIKLEGSAGGRVTGEPWSSEEIAKTGKIISLFYIDPEEKKLNESVENAYDNEHFPPEKHGSIAIINMAAAWYPNSLIDSQLKKKQEKYPRTIYVKDMHKTLVKEWDLKDDSVNVIIFGRDGKSLFVKRGPMTEDEISAMMKVIRSNL